MGGVNGLESGIMAGDDRKTGLEAAVAPGSVHVSELKKIKHTHILL